MMQSPVIPYIDPMPLPAPYWLFKVLLIVTFVLHILAMNTTFGGSLIALIARCKSAKNEHYNRLAHDLAKYIPSLLAATITLGIAPLLFTQVIYGHLFYTSTIVMAWPWFSVLLLLVLAYYGFYIVAFKQNGSTVVRWFAAVSAFFIFVIGFIYTNNMTLMLTPEKWMPMYQADPSGWNLNVHEATLIPRYLHFVLAALAVAGLLVAGLGFLQWSKDRPYATFLLQTGGKWFAYMNMAQIIIGLWFVAALPKPLMMLLMGQSLLQTILFAVGVLVALVLIVMMTRALKQTDPRKGVLTAMVTTALLVVLMALQRDLLRDSYLVPYFKPASLPVQTQWDVLLLFLVLFMAGVALWIVMMKRYFSSKAVQ
jgi:hypothetical protein